MEFGQSGTCVQRCAFQQLIAETQKASPFSTLGNRAASADFHNCLFQQPARHRIPITRRFINQLQPGCLRQNPRARSTEIGSENFRATATECAR